MLKRLADLLYRVLLGVSAALLAAMMLLTVGNVVLRYAFNMPIYGTVELTQFLMAAVVFAGFALVTRSRGHIVVTLFEPALLRWVPRAYRFLASAVNLGGVAFVAFLTIKSALFLAQGDERSLMYNVPEDWFWGCVSLLALAGVVFGIQAFDVSSDATPDRHGATE
ncbi:MAG TPA: TRAP transporter small permease [Burkholderiales bacterium]|nr:TRAP transporter small permease [Burkholderiales bacterium]